MKERINSILQKVKKFNSNMALNLISVIAFLLALFGAITSVIGYVNFTAAFKKEYDDTTYHMADSATTLVNAENLEAYLELREQTEYIQTKMALNKFCKKMNVSLIYVILVDQSDYNSFVSVFNLVNNTVDNTNYKEWALGYQRQTTNDEYRQKYKAIYEEGSAYETVYRFKVPKDQHPHITTLVPVKSGTGQVMGLLCIQRPISELNESRLPYLYKVLATTIVLMAMVCTFIYMFLKRQVVTPIDKVADEAQRFARENTKGKTLACISKYDEILTLSESIETMEIDTVNYIDSLTKATAEKERVYADLHLAARIQASMLNSEFPPFPDRNEFDLYAVMDPAREIGGDFYDFFFIDEDHLCLVIADVSGKGIPAALIMMISKVIIQSIAMLGRGVEDILTKTNEALCSSSKVEMFVTVWVGILEISTGKMLCGNAGHEYPAIYRKGGKYELLKDKHGFVLGGMDGMKYTEYELKLEPGDRIFVYTDGVPESTSAENELFGTGRMIDALNSDLNVDAQGTLGLIDKAVDAFVKEAEQFDDLTMLGFHYYGPERKPAESESKKKTEKPETKEKPEEPAPEEKAEKPAAKEKHKEAESKEKTGESAPKKKDEKPAKEE